MQIERELTPRRDSINKEKSAVTVNSNLAKLKDLYGDASSHKGQDGLGTRRDSSSEEVIKLGGASWR